MHIIRAFTLIELLIVVMIIAILAAIAVPNFLAAQTRAKVSRVQADFRTLATALESYFIDNNTYPDDAFTFPETGKPPYAGMIMLTTPIAYHSGAMTEVFVKGQYIDGRTGEASGFPPNQIIQYELGTGNDKNSGFPASDWALNSFGPDRDDDSYYLATYPQTQYAVPYDPTNGTISDGDIFRLHQPHLNFLADANPEYN